jgi:hypothetical protein
MSNDYPYIAINSQYFCLRQNPVRLAWYLLYQTKALNFRRAFTPQKKLGALKRFILIYLGLIKDFQVFRFPFFGHLVLKVHGGYRVFDFSRKIVTKMINTKSKPSMVMNEIKGVRTASQFDFAPKLHHWNISECWYEEELINGVIGYSLLDFKSATLFKIFEQEIAPCLEKMISVEPPRKTTVSEIVNQCSQTWEYGRLSRMRLDTEKVDVVYQFIQLIVSKLFNSPEQTVYRILTHGDFSFQNILSTKKRFVIIDWESIAHRSVLFDLYNFFLTELYYNRVSTNLISEIKEAIKSMQQKLISKNYEVANHLLTFAEVYRWLYYIERIAMLLERGLTDKIFDVIFRSIEVFESFERSVAARSNDH